MRGRWWLGVLFLAVLSIGAAWLIFFLRRHGFDWSAKFSEISSFALAALVVLVPVIGRIGLRLPAPRIKDEQVENDVNDLAAALRARARIEEVLPGVGIYDRLPMPVRWKPVQQAASEDGHIGTFDEVLEYFKRLPEPRLMVLGGAGAGKSILVSELARRLLAHRLSSDPVPVVVSVATWNPERTSLFNWISDQLIRINPELKQKVNDGHRTITRAQVLVDRMKVLPILDGLDEVGKSSLPMATLAINRFGWSQPLVVTCRSDEYLELIGARDGTPVARAAVIELIPLTIDDIKSYLGPDQDGHWAATYNRLDAEPHGALARALTNPLMLWLAWEVCQSAGGPADELADRRRFGSQEAIESYLLAEFVPALYPESQDHTAWPPWRRTLTAHQARRWLGFLATDSRLHERKQNRRNRRSRKARPRHGRTDNTFETRDTNVAWWHFTAAAGGYRFIGALVRAILLVTVLWQLIAAILAYGHNWHNGEYTGHIPFRRLLFNGPLGRAAWPTVQTSIDLAPTKTRNHAFISLNNALGEILKLPTHYLFLLILLALPLIAIYITVAEPERPQRLRFQPERMIGWVVGLLVVACYLVGLLLIAMLYWHRTSTVSAFFAARSTWITVAILVLSSSIVTLPTVFISEIDVVGATTPLESLREDRWAGITVKASRRTLVAMTLALLCGPFVTVIYALFATVSTVMAFTLGGLSGFASSAYTDACYWLAISRKMPWRPMRFLIDAERRGIFNDIGAIYRFRHIRMQVELQDWYRANRFRREDWLLRLPQLLDERHVYTSPRIQKLNAIKAKADSYRVLTRRNPPEFGPHLALTLNQLADMLADLRRRQDELNVRGEVTATMRELFVSGSATRLSLAESLERFAYCLAGAGRVHEALGVMGEAADLFGQSASTERTKFERRLANWIESLLLDPGPWSYTQSLLVAAHGMADIYRDLVLMEGDSATATYAASLVRLARAFQRLQRPNDAADAIKRAAQVYRELIQKEAPVTASARIEGLLKIAKMLEQAKLPDEAVAALTDAARVYRALAQAEPAVYSAPLAETLARLARLLRRLGRPQELDAIREAVSIYLAAVNDSAEESACPSLADLSDLAIRLWKLGETDAAIEAAQTGAQLVTAHASDPETIPFPSWKLLVEQDLPPRDSRSEILVRTLRASTDPYRWRGSAKRLQSLADEFDTSAFRLLASGFLHESQEASINAVRCSEESVKIYRNLSDYYPSTFLERLADSLDTLATYLRKVGSRENEAQAVSFEAHDIRRRLGLHQS
jgi:hypothetical protein